MHVRDDTDDDPAMLEPMPEQWRLFEVEVAKVQPDPDPDSIVEHDVRLEGVLSGVELFNSTISTPKRKASASKAEPLALDLTSASVAADDLRNQIHGLSALVNRALETPARL